eukprot:symbB.v1.2.021344.t1/scaffold1836.1/size99329/15
MISSSVDTGNLQLIRSIRIARALRGMRVVRLFRYVTALRTLWHGSDSAGSGTLPHFHHRCRNYIRSAAMCSATPKVLVKCL